LVVLDNYESKLEEIKKVNEKYLSEFENWLKEKKIGQKTINSHISNMDFYLNVYLNYYDITTMEDGVYDVYDFLGDWFIQKCLYASKTSIKENAASIKKFYKCMSELGYISKEDYESLATMLKDNMDVFLSSLDDFDNDTFYDDIFC